jgi:hypothetical protein
VPRAARSASARTGRCKKIAVSQRVFDNFLVPYVPRYSQFSCGFRRASEGRRNTNTNSNSCKTGCGTQMPLKCVICPWCGMRESPSDTAPLNSFLPQGASPPGNPFGGSGERINSPINPNLYSLPTNSHRPNLLERIDISTEKWYSIHNLIHLEIP